VARAVAFGLVTYMSAASLYWTGSKGGWLIGLILALVVILHLELPAKVRLTIMSVSLVLGLVVFGLRFSGYFQKGATSVGARFTYWQAALQTVREKPIFGTGPGTFAIAYRKVKPPEAEMAKLAHNDFLEQASDSGVIGGLSFATFVFGSLYLLYRQRPLKNWSYLLIWMGLLGWAMQSFIEFGLYIPAIAWPTFLFFGILWAQAKKS
jgi:putative inorganic carbon (hco3(-)) transporter